MSSGGDEAQAVDYSGVQSGFQNLSNQFGAYMRESYDWAKGQWKKQEPYSDEIQQIMLDQAKAGAKWATEDRALYDQTYKPIEKAYAEQVAGYDTPGRREAEAGRYAAAASNAAEQAADEAKRQLTTFGVKPTDVRMGALDTGTRMVKAANATAAAESARRNIENTGLALKQGVIPMGNVAAMRGLQNYGMSQAAGTAGTNVGLATDQTYGQLTGTPTQWGGLNVNALQGWNQSLTDQQKANIALKEANESGSGGFGKLAGTLIGGAAGAYFGGPMGMSAGASMGGQLGGMTGFAEGGVVDITAQNGGVVPPSMSPSGGAATDDIAAVIPSPGGGPPAAAAIDAGEFIFPRRAARYYGSKHLQGMVDKADQAMGLAPPKGGKAGGTPAPQRPAPTGTPPAAPSGPGVIPTGPPGYQAGGVVDPALVGWNAAQHAGTVQNMQQGADPWSRENVGKALGGMGGMGGMPGGGGGGAEPKKSALDIYARWGYADGGEVEDGRFTPTPEEWRGRRLATLAGQRMARDIPDDPGRRERKANYLDPQILQSPDPFFSRGDNRPVRFAKGGVVDARPFDPEGEGYDEETVRRLGLQPDSTGHGSTYAPGGMMLKGAHHPTRHLSVIEDERLGYESYKANDGRYYVRPRGGYGYAEGGEVQMAMAGERWTDPETGYTYESMGPRPVPPDESGKYAHPGYGGRIPWWMLHDDKGNPLPLGKMRDGSPVEYFRTLTPRTIQELDRKGAPADNYKLELFRRLQQGFPTS